MVVKYNHIGLPQKEVIPVVIRIDKIITYSGTTPYGRLVNTTTSLLRPFFVGCLAKTAIHFLVKKTLVNTATFFPLPGKNRRTFSCKKNPSLIRPIFWPSGRRINGVPLLWKYFDPFFLILSTASLRKWLEISLEDCVDFGLKESKRLFT